MIEVENWDLNKLDMDVEDAKKKICEVCPL